MNALDELRALSADSIVSDAIPEHLGDADYAGLLTRST
jgi:hypothetical protein